MQQGRGRIGSRKLGRGGHATGSAMKLVPAARLLEIEPWKSATAIKVNPDLPQHQLRAEALRRGILRLGQLPGNVAWRT